MASRIPLANDVLTTKNKRRILGKKNSMMGNLNAL